MSLHVVGAILVQEKGGGLGGVFSNHLVCTLIGIEEGVLDG